MSVYFLLLLVSLLSLIFFFISLLLVGRDRRCCRCGCDRAPYYLAVPTAAVGVDVSVSVAAAVAMVVAAAVFTLPNFQALFSFFTW